MDEWWNDLGPIDERDKYVLAAAKGDLLDSAPPIYTSVLARREVAASDDASPPGPAKRDTLARAKHACGACGCRATPQWRNFGSLVLCNACGVRVMRKGILGTVKIEYYNAVKSERAVLVAASY